MDFIDYLKKNSQNQILFNGVQFKIADDPFFEFSVDKDGNVKDRYGEVNKYSIEFYDTDYFGTKEWRIWRDSNLTGYRFKTKNNVVTLYYKLEQEEIKLNKKINRFGKVFTNIIFLIAPFILGFIFLFAFLFFEII